MTQATPNPETHTQRACARARARLRARSIEPEPGLVPLSDPEARPEPEPESRPRAGPTTPRTRHADRSEPHRTGGAPAARVDLSTCPTGKSPPRPPPRPRRAEEEPEQSPFSVIVGQVYDGPLDLLLDLIRKQDIDIYDIPIAKITAQFLAYVNQLKASDVDVAGEFIYTASLLIHIKSKMLLPRTPSGPEDAAEDPRRELVERLLEHERFKNAAQMLQQKQMLEAATWTNPGMREFKEDAAAEPEIAADTVDLVRIFRDILDRARKRPIFNVQEDSVTVGQMIQFLGRRLTMEDKPGRPAPPAQPHPIGTRPGGHVPGSAGAGPPAGHPAPPGPRLQRNLHQEASGFDAVMNEGLCQRPRRLEIKG